MRIKYLLLLPLLVASLQGAAVSDLTFSLINDGTEYSVTDCSESASGSLDIPSTYNGLPVTSIGGYAFWNCSSLTSITIPGSVASIGGYAFRYCYSLASITLPYKFAGLAGISGIPGDAEITVDFNDVSEGLLANKNFVAGISEEITFDSSDVDQAIVDEAQARVDAVVALQADIAHQAVVVADLQQQINDLQSYIDSALVPAVDNASNATDDFWISGTGKTHNQGCRYYGKGNGQHANKASGDDCKICGGAR